MHLTSIETTPNPNSMKLNLDELVGKPVTYTSEQHADSPEFVARLLDIEGVKSVFVCHDFITLNRDPRADWQLILDAATNILSGEQQTDVPIDEQRKAAEKLGQVSVFIQTFRGIPIQIKLSDGHEEKRIALDSRFSDAAQLVQAQSGADYLKERYWADWGVRYETMEEVASNVVEEIQGTIDAQAIEKLVAQALEKSTNPQSRSINDLQQELNSADWHRRLLAVQELGTTEEAVPLLIQALNDPNPQVRRLVAAALGATGVATAVYPLTQTLLNDSSIGVRRTAGDALSDLGDVSAQPAVCQALSDSNKLIRWRAARFLADVGTEEALPFLEKSSNDPEFEVRLEIKAAIERISGGKEGTLPAWKKILKDSLS